MGYLGRPDRACHYSGSLDTLLSFIWELANKEVAEGQEKRASQRYSESHKEDGVTCKIMDEDKGQALADTSRGAQRMTPHKQCCTRWACILSLCPQKRGEHP